MGTTINVVGMGDIERPLPSTVDWKVALLKKKFISVLKLRALVHVKSLLPATGFQPCHQNPRFESLHLTLSEKHRLGEHDCHSEFHVHSPKVPLCSA